MTRAARTAPSPDPMDDATLYGHLLTGRRRRLLIAEDDLEMRRLLVETLHRDGYEVAAVQDGAALLDEVRAHLDGPDSVDPFDLLVTDVRMPGWSGLDAVEVMRASRCLIPVLVVTAFGDADAHQRAHQLDAQLLDKPFELHELSRAVFDLLSRKPAWGFAPGFDDADEEDDPYLAAWGPVRRRRSPRPRRP